MSESSVVNVRVSQSPDTSLEGCDILIDVCARLVQGESVLIVTDATTRALGGLLADRAGVRSDAVRHLSIEGLAIHGAEPPNAVAAAMSESSVIFGLTSMSMAHTDARLAATTRGARYLSLPDYSLEVLQRRALRADFARFVEPCDALARELTAASRLTLRTELGTDLEFDIRGRAANASPGCCYAPGVVASPPDIEVNIAVIETATRGVAIVDGSIPCRELGRLDAPIMLEIENGRVQRIAGGAAPTLQRLFDSASSDRARVVAEFGIGLNPYAELCGSMLEDEGCLGTVHLGIGSNVTIGGENAVAFHLDHVIRGASIWIDGVMMMEDGELTDARYGISR